MTPPVDVLFTDVKSRWRGLERVAVRVLGEGKDFYVFAQDGAPNQGAGAAQVCDWSIPAL